YPWSGRLGTSFAIIVGVPEGGAMCLTCGCGRPNDDHGDPAHITMDDLQKAADAAEISVQEAANNLQQTLPKA
ncbi:MAG TPA: hypothetical protein VF972_00775, partial [Actinomycetota bacterium]